MKIQLMVYVMGIWIALGHNALADVVPSIANSTELNPSNRPSLLNLIPPDTVFYGDEYYDMDGGEVLDLEMSEIEVVSDTTEMSGSDRATSRRTPMKLGFSDVVTQFNEIGSRGVDGSDGNENSSSPRDDLEFGVYDFD